MKKIIGILLVVTLVTTSIFAQVSTGLQFRQRIDVLDADIKKNDKDKTTVKIFEQKHQDATNVNFAASTKNAGVYIEFDFDLGKDLMEKKLPFGDIYGWFSVAGFKLTGGKFSSRFTNRIIQDRGRALGLSYLRNAYGVAGDVIGQDGDNMAHNSHSSNKGLATIADYTFDLDFAKLLVKGALFAPNFNSIMQSGFGFEAAFQMDMFSIDLVAKFPVAYNTVVGAYFQMLPVDLIQFAIGFTLGLDTTNKKSSNETQIAYGIDGRVRIKPLDALAITVHVNFSQLINKKGSNKSSYNYIDAVANVTYDINDVFAIFGEVDWCNNKKEFKNGWSDISALEVQVGTLIRPVENVKLAASVQATIPTTKVADGQTAAKIGIPFVFDIAF